ncbi:MAG: PEP-CTERM sorting domain-containing protein [Planctomycetota bacterium]
MKFCKNAAVLAAGCAVAWTLAGSEQVHAQQVTLSVVSNVDNELGGVTFTDEDAIDYNIATDIGTSFFSVEAGDLDAFHLLPNGNVLVSTAFNGSFNGVTFDDGDIVEINPTTLAVTTVFSSDSVFTSTSEDVDAVSVAPNGDLLLSVQSDASIGSEDFSDGDILRFVPGTSTLSVEVAESDIFLFPLADLDGIHLLNDGRFALSTVADETVGSVAFEDGDIFIYDPVADTATLFFDEDSFGGTTDQDVNALFVSAIPEPATLGLLAVAGLGLLRRRGSTS